MDFSLTKEQQLFIRTIREFCTRYIDPIWEDMDEKGEFSTKLIEELARLGVYGGVLSEEYGGSEMTFLEAVLAVEEISSHDPTLAISAVIGLSNSWTYIIQLYGSDEAKTEILPRITSGEAFIGIASTESQSGTDLAGLRTMKAEKIGNGKWLIDGEKNITSGGLIIKELKWGGGWFTITRTRPIETRHKGLTDFIIYYKKNGKMIKEVEYNPYKHVGRHAFDSGSLIIRKLELDDMYRVGGENEGFRVAVEGFNIGRMIICGSLIGGVKWALKYGLNWIRDRELFGNPLASYQGISFKLAELYEELEAVKLLTYKAAWLADRFYKKGDPTIKALDIGLAASTAKVKATRLAIEAIHEVMEWYGGMAYFRDIPVFRALLGAMAYKQGSEGAAKALHDLIARNIVAGRLDI